MEVVLLTEHCNESKTSAMHCKTCCWKYDGMHVTEMYGGKLSQKVGVYKP